MPKSGGNFLGAAAVAGALILAAACSGGATVSLGPGAGTMKTLSPDELDNRLAQYVRVEMEHDASGYSDRKKEVLKNLIEAGKLIERAYWDQAHRGGWMLRRQFEASDDPLAAKVYQLLLLNAGPFDRLHDNEPFLGENPRPPGAGFYPPDLTKEELETYLEAHPDVREELLHPYTVVHRSGELLVTIPYHQEYRKWINPVARFLIEAARHSGNRSLRNFLRKRAEALRTDEYYDSDLAWIDMTGNEIELVLGPYETYEDKLMGVKTSYEATIGLKDEEESRRLEVYTRNLLELERNLPFEDRFKREQVALDSPMVVVTDIFRGGDLAHGYQAVAANLPNDPRVHEAKGTKKTFWKNMMEARLEKIIQPIAAEVIAADQAALMNGQAYFNVVLMHEIAHALGPNWVGEGADRKAVNEVLKEHASSLEEAKASLAGLHSLEWFMDEGIVPRETDREHYVAYLGGLFRTIRFGTTEAHGQASLLSINWHREKGALDFNAETGKWSVDFERMPDSVSELAGELLTIQATGDYARAGEILSRYGTVGPDLQATIDRVAHLPVAIQPVYSVKWE